jgi:hypothetical protein
MASDLGRCVLPDIDFSEAVLLDFHKMAVTLSVLWITAATTVMLAAAQEAALSEGERHGLAACLVKCPDKACVNRCMSKSQTRGVVRKGWRKPEGRHMNDNMALARLRRPIVRIFTAFRRQGNRRAT